MNAMTAYRLLIHALLVSAILVACAPITPAPTPVTKTEPLPAVTEQSEPLPAVVEQQQTPAPLPVITVDPMADVFGDKPLPRLQGVFEKIDCKTGTDDLHARIALEARGGRVTNFAYYSIWKPKTCSINISVDSPNTKWRMTADGHARVQSPEGRFLIRSRPDAYIFEFENVSRQRFCGMYGEINGSMTVKRGKGGPACSVVGIMDTNDDFLESLHGLRAKN